MADNIIKTFTIRVDTSNGKFEVDGLTKGFVKQETALKSLNKEVQKQNKELGKLVDKSGLAGAAVVEIGRTISDANYGFTAVANNISQLSTLLVTLIATTGGAKNAWEALMKAFRGPLGIIVLFQIVIAVLEKLSMKNKEAEKTVESLDSKIRSQTRSIELLIDRIEKLNNSNEERKALLISLSSINEDLNNILNDRNVTEEQAIKNAKSYLQELKKRNEVEAVKKALQQDIAKNDDILIEKEKERTEAIRVRNILQGIDTYNYNRQNEKVKAIEKEIADIRKQRLVIENDFIEAIKELNSLESQRIANAPKSVALYEEQISLLKKLRDSTATTSEMYNAYTAAIKLNEDAIKKITGEEEKTVKKRIRLFKEELINLTSLEEKYRLKGIQSDTLFEEDRIALRKRAAIRELEIKVQSFKEEQKLRYDQFVLQLNLDKQLELAKAKSLKERQNIERRYNNANTDAKQKYNNSIITADDRFKQALLVVNQSFALQTESFFTTQRKKDFEGYVEQLAISNDMAKLFQITMATNELDRIAAEDELRKQQFDREKFRLEEKIKLDKSRGLSTLEDEEKLTNVKIKFKQDEDKSFEKSEKAKLAIANKVGQAIIGIAGEGSAIGKAVAVAMAIMNTKEAITAALGAKPYGPWNIAQAVATGLFGMQQVREIMATKLPVGDTGGGGGATSVSVAAPDFNVVGQGAGSQLAGVVGARFGEPIKAYVLSSDVTSAQEMDRKIDSTATIG